MDETKLEIFWTQKQLGPMPHTRIVTVGGILPAGRWEMLESEAVHAVVLRRHSFFVTVNGVKVDIVIARQDDRWYLKGQTDSYTPKTLLDLPDGPPGEDDAAGRLSVATESHAR
ncbi:MAG TPA: hypothetical protein VG838_06065 [Opitutaceae bacterium]|nr:hypothetical protein [Opitutaceae bacterium]